MLVIDWIIVILWLLGTLKGWSRGLVCQAVSILAIILGFLLAKAFCSVLGTSLAPESEHPVLVSGICFVLIWLMVPIAFGLVGELVSVVLDKLCILGTVNKLGGALIGFLKYGFVLGALVWVLSAVDIIGEETLQQSVFCSSLREIPVGVYRILISDGGAS
ncbi:MAG: CvpA family protein [Bacteroidaceae bacterium]